MNNKKEYELIRAIWHVGTQLILVWMLNYVKPVLLTAIIFIGIAIIELSRLRLPKLNSFIANNKYSLLREDEVNDFSTLFSGTLAFLLISWLPLNLLKAAILVNAFADPSARLFGIRWGHKRILNTQNSWVGSSAFFTVAFLVCIYFVNPLPALAAAATGTIAEFVPDKKPFWMDNLRITVFVGLVLWVAAG